MILSVEISAQWIHMVSARRRGRGVEIAGFGRMPTPEGCVKNGIVVNSSQLGEALARVARENGLRGKRMCLAVTSPAISFRELEVPAANLGRAMGDIQQMGGTFDPAETIEDTALLTGSAPVAGLAAVMTLAGQLE